MSDIRHFHLVRKAFGVYWVEVHDLDTGDFVAGRPIVSSLILELALL